MIIFEIKKRRIDVDSPLLIHSEFSYLIELILASMLSVA